MVITNQNISVGNYFEPPQFNKVNNKELLLLVSGIHMVLHAQCSSLLAGSSVVVLEIVILVYSSTSFCPPPPLPDLPFPSPLLTQCDGCLEDCVGAHGWVAGIASHGSVIHVLSRGRLVKVEAPGYLRHPCTMQLLMINILIPRGLVSFALAKETSRVLSKC